MRHSYMKKAIGLFHARRAWLRLSWRTSRPLPRERAVCRARGAAGRSVFQRECSRCLSVRCSAEIAHFLLRPDAQAIGTTKDRGARVRSALPADAGGHVIGSLGSVDLHAEHPTPKYEVSHMPILPFCLPERRRAPFYGEARRRALPPVGANTPALHHFTPPADRLHCR
jgi:hypothetical protein